MKSAAIKYKDNINTEIKKGKLGGAYAAIRKLGAGANDTAKNSFEIASFIDAGLSNQ